MDNKIVNFGSILKNHTGTIYIFEETGTGNLLFKTTDIRELQKAVSSQTIANGETILIENIKYEVVGFEIEVSSSSPTLSIAHSMQIGENNPYGIQTVIYLKKK